MIEPAIAGAATYVSPQIEEITGYPVEHWLGEEGVRRWLENVHPDDRPLANAWVGRDPETKT